MKRLHSISLSLLCAAVLSACAKEDTKKGDAAVADGLCTARTVELMNQIPNKMIEYRESKSAEALQVVDQSCQELKNSLGDRTCQAIDRNQAGAKVEVSYAQDAAAICDEAARLLRPTELPGKPAGEEIPNPDLGELPPLEIGAQPAPANTTIKLSAVGAKLSAKITDALKAEQLARAARNGDSLFAVGGALVAGDAAIERIAQGSVGCGLHSDQPLKAGVQNSTTAIGERDRSVYSAYVAFDSYILVCIKTGSPPTLQEGQRALKGIVELTLR